MNHKVAYRTRRRKSSLHRNTKEIVYDYTKHQTKTIQIRRLPRTKLFLSRVLIPWWLESVRAQVVTCLLFRKMQKFTHQKCQKHFITCLTFLIRFYLSNATLCFKHFSERCHSNRLAIIFSFIIWAGLTSIAAGSRAPGRDRWTQQHTYNKQTGNWLHVPTTSTALLQVRRQSFISSLSSRSL